MPNLQVSNFNEAQTGGGCTALQRLISDHVEVLITTIDPQIPTTIDDTIVFGFYNWETGEDATWEVNNKEEAINLVNRLHLLAYENDNQIAKIIINAIMEIYS